MKREILAFLALTTTAACGDRDVANGSTGVRNANVAEAWQHDVPPDATKPAPAKKSPAGLVSGAPAPPEPDGRSETDREL